MPVPFNEAMYPGVKQWLVENPQDKSLSEPIKQSLLRFETLTEREKEQLQAALLAIYDLPEVLQQFMPNRLGTLPVELLDIVDKHLTPQDRRELAATDRRKHSVFHQSNLHAKFLECVAYGQQDKAEKLLSQVFQGQPARIEFFPNLMRCSKIGSLTKFKEDLQQCVGKQLVNYRLRSFAA